MKTILLADDSITIQKVVELTFSDGDYRVLCVSNGAQALRKIAEARPDVALLDVIMPEKNGYEVCEAMKADPATASIPVLLLTGTFEPFDRQRAETAGADGHLTKPFESHALVARVEELIDRGAARPAATVAAAPVHAATMRGGPTAASRAPAAGPGLGLATAAALPGHTAPLAPPVESAPPDGPHPAFAEPDAAAGGSYMGFADLSIGEDEVVPDRYDVGDSPATVRIARDEAPQSSTPGDDTPSLEGFVPGYDLPPRSAAAPVTATAAAEPQPAPVGVRPTVTVTAAGTDPGTTGTLSDAALERLAEMIVRRMSDRVVREIAWEVIPGVAEAIVRQRIREIEGQDR